uniref:Nuclease HARBI1 n=1 Tax=Cyprinus carpio TaxID=7962 RepID=A0A8C2AYD0_CYPCA
MTIKLIAYNLLLWARFPKTFLSHFDILPEVAILKKFRLPRQLIMELLDLLRPALARLTRRNFALSPEVQLLAALRSFATGSFIEVVGEGYGLSKTSVWRCVHSVTNALLRQAGDYIRLPATCQEVQEVHQGCHAIAGIPRVLGLVDGTLIPIANPSVIDQVGEGAYTGFPFRCFASCIALRVARHTDNVHYKLMSLRSIFKQAFISECALRLTLLNFLVDK